jgi:hypothetical protein
MNVLEILGGIVILLFLVNFLTLIAGAFFVSAYRKPRTLPPPPLTPAPIRF